MVADTLHAAGVSGAAEVVAEQVEGLQRTKGYGEDVATFGVSAQQIAGLTNEQRRAAMAGYLLSGKTAQLTGTKEEIRSVIDEAVKLGEEPESQEFLEGYLRDLGGMARAQKARPHGEDAKGAREARRHETAVQETAR